MLERGFLMREWHCQHHDVGRARGFEIFHCIDTDGLGAPLGHHALQIGKCRLRFFQRTRSDDHSMPRLGPTPDQTGTECTGATKNCNLHRAHETPLMIFADSILNRAAGH